MFSVVLINSDVGQSGGLYTTTKIISRVGTSKIKQLQYLFEYLRMTVVGYLLLMYIITPPFCLFSRSQRSI